MSSTSRRAVGPWGNWESLFWFGLALVVMAGVIIAAGAGVLADEVLGRHGSRNLVTFSINVARGRTPWPTLGTVFAIAFVVAIFAVAGGMAWLFRHQLFQGEGEVDRANRYLGSGKKIAALLRPAVAAKARRFGVKQIGIPIALTLGRMAQTLWIDWEGVMMCIAGPRSGKTTTLAIPSIVQAPGAAIVTSNKRDLVDATRDVRAKVGQVWIFDPQEFAAEPIGMWWNPLKFVTDLPSAQQLAEIFADAIRKQNSTDQAFFDRHGEDLVALLLLAAAVSGRYLDAVFEWVENEQSDDAVYLLQEHGFKKAASGLAAEFGSANDQRSGVFGTAQGMVAFLKSAKAMRWVLPPELWHTLDGSAQLIGEVPDKLPEFDPARFVASGFAEGHGDTLYCLSKEGESLSAGPIVSALTIVVTQTAERIAARKRGGRLPVPMIVCLDEVFNVCPWRNVRAHLTHYGSRGILLQCYAQVWSQGERAFGREGMQQLWSAANVKIYGGSVDEIAFLEDLSRRIGDYAAYSRTVTSGSGPGSSVQRSMREARILDVADLAALPNGRMIVLAHRCRAVLARPIHWKDLPAELVKGIEASLAAHDPQGEDHLEPHLIDEREMVEAG